MDCSPTGSSVHGIFQARVLEWGAIAFSVRRYNSTYFILSSLVFYRLKVFRKRLEKLTVMQGEAV